jgi:PEP-CTERM motif
MKLRLGRLALGTIIALSVPAARADFRIVDLMPHTSSDDILAQTEPNISLNKLPAAANSQILVGTFDGDDFTKNPYFLSTNRGQTFSISNTYTHGDTTADYSPTGTAYAGFLVNDGSQIDVRSSPGPNGGGAFANNLGSQAQIGPAAVAGTSPDPDQPWVRATRTLGLDDIYVAYNDVAAAGGKTATLHYNGIDGANPWRDVTLDHVGNALGDSPSVRVAVAPGSSKVYGAFQRYTGNIAGTDDRSADIVVVRDDAPVAGVRAFTSITNADGRTNNEAKIATGARVPYTKNNSAQTGTTLGGLQKLRSNLSIAVDPKHDNIAYLAYDQVIGGNPTIQVFKTTNSGDTWDNVGSNRFNTFGPTAMPALAVNDDGRVGLLYYSIGNTNANTLGVYFSRSDDQFATATTTTLATMSIAPGSVMRNAVTYGGNDAAKTNPYDIGDFIDLEAAGSDFYGSFIASNRLRPDDFQTSFGDANSIFNRNYQYTVGDPTTFTLMNNAFDAPVAFSLDPFLFTTASAVAEPATLALLSVGLAGLGLLRKRVSRR